MTTTLAAGGREGVVATKAKAICPPASTRGLGRRYGHGEVGEGGGKRKYATGMS